MDRAQRRRDDLFAVLDRHDKVTRHRLDRFEASRPAVADAIWSATWQLRLDVAEALDRCEQAERQAWWCQDD